MEALFIIVAGVCVFECGVMAERHRDLAYDTKPIIIPKASRSKVRLLRKVPV